MTVNDKQLFSSHCDLVKFTHINRALSTKMSCDKSKALTRKDFIRLVSGVNSIEYLYQEYQKIKNIKTEGTFRACITAANFEDERYGERLCFDHNCVILSKEKGVTNFINASYINGFQQSKAYVATVTPYSEATIYKFWRMVWEHQSEIIVMLNAPINYEEGIYYWNPNEGDTFHCEKFRIETVKVQMIFQEIQLTKLCVTHENGDELFVNHFLFNWQDKYISTPEYEFLQLVKMVRLYNKFAVKQDDHTKSPIVIHCSDGTGRTMAFCAIDTEISRFLITRRVDLYSTLSELKKNRFDSFDSLDDVNYLSFIHLVLCCYFKTYPLE
ncbi:receptor-type tyrosine-protein phosphatase delta-like [Cydia pomonella]|uniref:receptor-type tyrosine-protein phosphatase delta-like n=1 Tax=Cydia pomonella TaxID=82600 RepID=UPI002ADE77CC|nr:receptor-type tyrosine-protein phosphatase delta-like [Cydia pomonella]